MERITITKTLKCLFCGVPPSNFSRNVDIEHRGVLTWISNSSPISRQKLVSFSYLRRRKWDCVDVIWRHSYSYVVLPVDMYIHIHISGYTNIYRVIGIILLAISPNLPGWAIIELSIRRQCAHYWSVGDRKRVVNIVVLNYRHDMRSGLQLYVLICTSFKIFLSRSNNFRDSFNCQSVGQHKLIEKLF